VLYKIPVFICRGEVCVLMYKEYFLHSKHAMTVSSLSCVICSVLFWMTSHAESHFSWQMYRHAVCMNFASFGLDLFCNIAVTTTEFAFGIYFALFRQNC